MSVQRLAMTSAVVCMAMGSSSCGGDGRGDASGAEGQHGGPVSLRGAIQKGPFVIGSPVTAAAIDDAAAPTGQVFTTETTDDLGSFQVSFSYRGHVELQAQGYFYDEITGLLSGAPIVLRALYDVTSGGTQTAYVNVITEMAHDRAAHLMSSTAATLASAEQQAETDLANALGIGGPGFHPSGSGITFDEIGGDSDQNGYLFGVSTVLMQAAVLRQQKLGGSIEAHLEELLGTIGADLAPDGTVSSALVAELRTAEKTVDVDLVMEAFEARLQETGSTATLADLNRGIDSDGDGYRNKIDTCPLIANPVQTTIPTGVLCSLRRRVTVVTNTYGAYPNSGAILMGDFLNRGHLSFAYPSLPGLGAFSADGTGLFYAGGFLNSPASPWTASFAYDVNVDGHIDLVGTADGASSSIYSWSAGDGAGTGNFGSPTAFPDPSVGPRLYNGIVLTDLNGDGRTDVVRLEVQTTLPHVPYALTISLGGPGGTFNPPSSVSLPSWVPTAWATGVTMFAGDVDGDHHVDVVAFGASNPGATVVTLRGDGAGGLSFLTQTSLPGVLIAPIGLGDFDGDGHLDAADLLPVGGYGNVTIAFGDGTGALGSLSTTSFEVGPNPGDLNATDLDGDGKTDLFGFFSDSANPNLADLDVVISAGRTFYSPQRLRSTIVTGRLGKGDLNADGIADITAFGQDEAHRLIAEGMLIRVAP